MSKGNKGFFSIAQKAWPQVCALGLNPAVAYLVLARFSGPDNVTTSASTNAVEKYANMSRSRSKEAIENLCKAERILKVKDGTHPRYKLSPGEIVKESKGTSPARRRREAQAKKASGEAEAEEKAPKEPVIWLPNSIVDGVVGAPSPLQLLRQTQDVMTLRLFVELYSAQNLIEDLGVSRKIVYQKYTRELIAELAEWNIWGFDKNGTFGGWHPVARAHYQEGIFDTLKRQYETDAKVFFGRIGVLENLGLFDWVPVVFESEDPSAEPMFELGDVASEVSASVYGAAETLLEKRFGGEGAVAREVAPYTFQIPILKHLSRVQVFGVARLHYRPHTSMTSTWWRKHKENEAKLIAKYEQVSEKHMDPYTKEAIDFVKQRYG